MNENPIQALMTTTMQSIKQMIDVNTVVGEAVTTDDGTIIIPVTKVSFGFAASGVEMQKQQQQQSQQGDSKYPFGGGSGCGAKIEPIAFLVIAGGNVKLVPVKAGQTPIERILDLVPDLVDKANGIIKDYTKKPTVKKETKDTDELE